MVEYFEISDLFFRFDYKPKHFNAQNVRDGKVAEFANILPIEAADISLPKVNISGVRIYWI